MRLTARGRALLNFTVVLAFLMVMGFVGWLETLGYQ
jgi:hypothetical protein